MAKSSRVNGVLVYSKLLIRIEGLKKMSYEKHDIVYSVMIGASFLFRYEIITGLVDGESHYVGHITDSPDYIWETRNKKLAEEVAHHFGGFVARSEKVGELINGRIIER